MTNASGRPPGRAADPWIPAIAILAFVAVAAWMRWDQDDAFISYRYAQHLLEGEGLVWTPGEPVEGYTNFLWVLALAAVARLGIEIPVASHLLSLSAFAGSLVTVVLLARRLFGSHALALLALVLVGSNFSFLAYATGGLETSLMALLTLVLILLAVRGFQDRHLGVPALFGMSLLFALACMTRPDAVIVCAVTGAVAVWVVASAPAPLRAKVLRLAILVGPAGVLLSGWLWWKLGYYGELLPNTHRVKLDVTTLDTYVRGIAYVALFFASFWMLPALLVSLRAGRRALGGAFWILAAFAALWLAYVIRVGGDIMEFRLLVPAIPVLVLLLVNGVFAAVSRPAWRFLLLGLLPVGSLVHALFFPSYVTPRGISHVPELSHYVARGEPTSWSTMGMALHDAFEGTEGPVIAISPAGAIPYFSELPAIDVLGLNDRWVAQHGYRRQACRTCIAHPRLATIAYLRQAGVHLVIGHPQVVRSSEPPENVRAIVRGMFYDEDIDFENIPAAARLVVIPTRDGLGFAALMLLPHPAVARAIDLHDWPVSRPWHEATSGVGAAGGTAVRIARLAPPSP